MGDPCLSTILQGKIYLENTLLEGGEALIYRGQGMMIFQISMFFKDNQKDRSDIGVTPKRDDVNVMAHSD